ncbi:hypothetical protein J7K43_06790 [Candidatus Calescamantes bacterium]|nr:hypothetical protein [Candidatus Calescamantes bacterium]
MNWPFSKIGEKGKWSNFNAAGFTYPVVGIVYNGEDLRSGLPLGGLGTGYIELKGDGTLGKSSIFNQFSPPIEFNCPFLSISLKDKTYLLTTHPPGGKKGIESIDYWGHFPIADLKYHSRLPLEIGLRIFTPFVLGDAFSSNIPSVLFEIRMKNKLSSSLNAILSLFFPGPITKKRKNFLYTSFKGKYSGIIVTEKGVIPREYGLAVKTNIEKREINVRKEKGEIALSISLSFKPQETKTIQGTFSWFYPYFKDSSGEPHTHHYFSQFKGVKEVINFTLSHFSSLLERTLSWQEKIYQSNYPEWLKDALINSLYSLAKNSLWVMSNRPDSWYPKQGFFTHSESFTGCPITETMVCRIHGHFPLLFFFPELEYSTLYGFKHFQISNGEIPFSFGSPTSLRDPRYHCQHPLNSGEYIQMVYQYYLRTKDKKFLKEFYPSVKKAFFYQKSLDYDNDGLVNEHSHALPGELWPANQFYDIWPWYGTSSYVAGIWLATLETTIAIAKLMRDKKFAEDCQNLLKKAKRNYVKKLWNRRYFSLYNDKEKGRNDICLANQLMGIWCTKILGLDSPLPQSKINKALDSIEKLNFQATEYGLVNGVDAKGRRFSTREEENDHGKQIFFGENICSAMVFIYNGKKEIGMEVARRLVEAVFIKHKTPWNQFCLISSEDGHPIWGDDYYSNMVIWAFPLALFNQNIEEFTKNVLRWLVEKREFNG